MKKYIYAINVYNIHSEADSQIIDKWDTIGCYTSLRKARKVIEKSSIDTLTDYSFRLDKYIGIFKIPVNTCFFTPAKVIFYEWNGTKNKYVENTLKVIAIVKDKNGDNIKDTFGY